MRAYQNDTHKHYSTFIIYSYMTNSLNQFPQLTQHSFKVCKQFKFICMNHGQLCNQVKTSTTHIIMSQSKINTIQVAFNLHYYSIHSITPKCLRFKCLLSMIFICVNIPYACLSTYSPLLRLYNCTNQEVFTHGCNGATR